MSKKKILILMIFIVVMINFLLVLGFFAAGSYLLWRFDLPVSEVKITTYFDYYRWFGFNSPVKKILIEATIILSLPCLLLAVIFIAALVPKGKMNTLYGDASFSSYADLSKINMIYKEKKFKIEPNERLKGYEHPPVFLGKIKGKYICDYSQLYTSVSATPGAGKGVGFVIPNLLQYPESVVAFDPKMELWKLTSGFRSSVLKQECYMFRPDANKDDGYKTHCYNPLDYISKDKREYLSSIKSIVNILIPTPSGDNQSFFISAQNLVSGIILMLIEIREIQEEQEVEINEREGVNLNRVINIIRSSKGLDAALISYITKYHLSDTCKGLLMSYVLNANEKGKDSTKSISDSFLDIFAMDIVAKATSHSSFRLDELRKKKMTVYAGAAPSNVPMFERLFNLFFSQCNAVNTTVLPENASSDDPLPYQCLEILDELPALGEMVNLRKTSGYSRGYNMRMALIFQNKPQLTSSDMYGREGAEGMLDTMHNELVLSTKNEADAKRYSEKIGDITIREKHVSRSGGSGGASRSISMQYHRRPLMLPQEIINMDKRDMLIFREGIKPIKAKKIFWYKEKFFIDRANLPCPFVPSIF